MLDSEEVGETPDRSVFHSPTLSTSLPIGLSRDCRTKQPDMGRLLSKYLIKKGSDGTIGIKVSTFHLDINI